MLRFIFRGVAGPTVAGCAAASALQATQIFSNEAMTNLGPSFNSPMDVAAGLTAVAAAGATGYLLNRPKVITEPPSPKL